MDGTARIVSKEPDGESLRLKFEPAKGSGLLRYVVEKGYVTIDGASLTVTRVDEATFEVMLIQHTQTKITLGRKAVGARVNVEVDMVGKYVEKSVQSVVEQAVDAALARRGL